MKTLLITALMLASSSALADGFVCETESGVVVKVYNNVHAEEGTRTPAVMIISDSVVSAGRKTIAKFTDAEGLVTADGASYTGNVDLRYNNTGRKGEWISGTKLGEIDTLHLDVEFSYATPVRHGKVLPALFTVVKRNGDEIQEDATCTRYLKN